MLRVLVSVGYMRFLIRLTRSVKCKSCLSSMIFYSDTFQRRKATPNTCKNLDKSPREKRKSET